MSQSAYWVYILYCNNHTYYTGYTDNLEKRYQSHLDGTGKCKYTRSFKPLYIAQAWKIAGDRALALRVERYIKSLSRTEKEQLIACASMLAGDYVAL
jgi:putative endonuclease